jgi:hypothetical protein
MSPKKKEKNQHKKKTKKLSQSHFKQVIYCSDNRHDHGFKIVDQSSYVDIVDQCVVTIAYQAISIFGSFFVDNYAKRYAAFVELSENFRFQIIVISIESVQYAYVFTLKQIHKILRYVTVAVPSLVNAQTRFVRCHTDVQSENNVVRQLSFFHRIMHYIG